MEHSVLLPEEGVERLRFPNGFQVVWRPLPATRLCHTALLINTGSRDERPGEEGLAHLIEHMVFKGTRRRKAYHILNRIDSVGGELNAYTDKEHTAYYTTATAEHLERSVELLIDLAFHARFEDRELRKEQQVVSEEIDMYADSPEEMIFERFDEQMYAGHPLAHPVLGHKEQVRNYRQPDLQRFAGQQYAPQRMVLSVAGKLNPQQLHRLAAKYIAPLPAPGGNRSRSTASPQAPFRLSLPEAQYQGHLIIGGEAPARTLTEKIPFQLLNYYLGGNAMNNRLSMQIREKHGLAYNLFSFANLFSDTGQWGIYAGAEAGNLATIERLIRKELTRLTREKLSATRLKRLKKQYTGALLVASESPTARMMHQGKALLVEDRVPSLEETLRKIENLSAETLLETANRYMQPDRLSVLSFAPER